MYLRTGQVAMTPNAHFILILKQSIAATVKSDAQDMQHYRIASVVFTLASTSGANITLALQGSNAVPPNGNIFGNTTGTANAWVPPDNTFFTLDDTNGTPISEVVTGDGLYPLAASLDAKPFKWFRAFAMVNTGGGGTIIGEAFFQGY